MRGDGSSTYEDEATMRVISLLFIFPPECTGTAIRNLFEGINPMKNNYKICF